MADWYWNPAAQRYQDAATGRFLAGDKVLEWTRESISASQAASDKLAELVAERALSPDAWELLMREELKREYIRQYLAGIGGQAQMTQADWGSIGGMLKEQYIGHLDIFADEIAAGKLSEAQIRSRARMYFESAKEAYERANARARSGGELVLPAYPGDGQTVCLTNCHCTWEIVEVRDDEGNVIGWDCTWAVNHAVENCDDCLENGRKWAPLTVMAG